MNANKIDPSMLTNYQLSRKVVASSKNWLRSKGYNDVRVHCIRGIFHVTNANNYMMDAKYVLESATGLEFTTLNAYMARLKAN